VLPADRAKQLEAFLAAKFPVETALNAAARQRDESLRLAEPALPDAVHAALSQQLRSARVAAKPFEVLRHFRPWREVPSLRPAYRAASVAAAAVIIALASLNFWHARNPATGRVKQPRPSTTVDQDPALLFPNRPFEQSEDRLTLRVARLELASLEPSFHTMNRALPNLEQKDRVLSLELPITQIRLDVETARTP
jgi:hypothetical protein